MSNEQIIALSEVLKDFASYMFLVAALGGFVSHLVFDLVLHCYKCIKELKGKKVKNEIG